MLPKVASLRSGDRDRLKSSFSRPPLTHHVSRVFAAIGELQRTS
jgi:hypothetical protein